MPTSDPTFMVSDFFEAFRKNWKQGVGLFFLDLLVSAVVILSLMFYWKNADQGAWMFIPLGICLLMMVVMFFMRFYAYLMAVTVELKFKHILKNALIFAFFRSADQRDLHLFYLAHLFPVGLVLSGYGTGNRPHRIFHYGNLSPYTTLIPILSVTLSLLTRKSSGKSGGSLPKTAGEPDSIFTDVGTKERPCQRGAFRPA